MNLRRKFLKFLAVIPLFANNTARAETSKGSKLNDQAAHLNWGHININVSNIEASIEFYRKLGFEVFIPAIPYLGLTMGFTFNQIDSASSTALGLPDNVSGRACIMQLGNGFPKIDLTQYDDLPQLKPLNNGDLGLVRICLGSSNLISDYERLVEENVAFI
ncbi:MAG: lyase, partial [Gammaproteobacteria bacterium]|nr:lyase [Gammaproteobacteria bacterium]